MKQNNRTYDKIFNLMIIALGTLANYLLYDITKGIDSNSINISTNAGNISAIDNRVNINTTRIDSLDSSVKNIDRRMTNHQDAANERHHLHKK